MTMVPQQPKPFSYIALGKPPRREEPVGHHLYDSQAMSGVIEGWLSAVTPVHVASGVIELSEYVGLPTAAPALRDMVKKLKVRYLPGTSVKGCVRSIVETITASCIRVTRARVDEAFKGCGRKNNLCPACRMFGALGYEGRIIFSDAVQMDPGPVALAKFPSLYAPRGRDDSPRRKIYHTHKRVANTGTIPTEVCPTNSRFRLSIRFENLSKPELGVLLTALGMRVPFRLKLGGGRPAGYGQLTVGPTQIRVRDVEKSWLDWDAPMEKVYAGPEQLRTLIPDLVKAADPLLVEEQLKRFLEIVKSEHEPPEGAY